VVFAHHHAIFRLMNYEVAAQDVSRSRISERRQEFTQAPGAPTDASGRTAACNSADGIRRLSSGTELACAAAMGRPGKRARFFSSDALERFRFASRVVERRGDQRAVAMVAGREEFSPIPGPSFINTIYEVSPFGSKCLLRLCDGFRVYRAVGRSSAFPKEGSPTP
jgi:hypothetical protein